MKQIYLDNAATTPVDEKVLKAMLPFFSNTFGNASSLHSEGLRAKIVLEQARKMIAKSIGALPEEIIFTSPSHLFLSKKYCANPAQLTGSPEFCR